MIKYIYMMPVQLRIAVAIAIGILVVCLFIVEIRKTTMEGLRGYAYRAMKYAEKKMQESGRGSERMAFVVKHIKRRIPAGLRPFISDRFIKETLQLWFYQIKDLLDDGTLNMSEPLDSEEGRTEQDKIDFIERNTKE